ncbi:MAG: response regulator [Lachnospiraceae bacterium]|nr:response regulator [Lachnospiraceae bacterium]
MIKPDNKTKINIPVEKTEEKYDRAIVFSAKVFFFLFLILTFFQLIFFSITDNIVVMEMDTPVYIEEWTLTKENGDAKKIGRYIPSGNAIRENYTLSSTLPEKIIDDSLLCFQTGKDVEVYIDGKLRKDYVEARDVNIPGGSVKRFFMTVPLNAADSGKDLMLLKKGCTKREQPVPETFVCSKAGFYSLLFHRYGASFIMAVAVSILAFIVTVVSIVMILRYRQRINMLYGSLGVLIVALWAVTNSFLFPFLFGHYHVDGVTNYMLCLLLPFGPALYLNSIMDGTHRKLMHFTLILAVGNGIFWSVLHFTGIFSFASALYYIDAVLGLVVLVAAVMLLSDVITGRAKKYKYTAMGFIGFLAFSLIEIVLLLFVIPVNEEIPMLMGLVFFLIYVIYQQVDDLRMIYKEKEEAEDLSKAKTQFLASMSHEIRTPINAILGMNEMILRENSDAVIGEYARSVKSSGKMLLMLVNDVLDFSRIEAGRLEIVNGKFRLAELLGDIMPMLEERAREKDLDLSAVVQGEVPGGLESDEVRIRQILINLINNAIKYTDRGSVTLEVSGRYEGQDRYLLQFAVKDTGRGIPEEEQGHLFEAFSRADLKQNSHIEGTGLGLAIVKSIVDSMEGTVNVESRYGKGSVFTVQLPVTVRDKTPVPANLSGEKAREEEKEKSSFTAPAAKILAVDDNRSNLNIIRLLLKRTGCTLDLCDSGEKAAGLCRKKQYDLILLDHMMPEPDGIQTLKMIRSDEDSLNRETKAIMVTANAMAGSKKIYQDAGFADYIKKPIDPAILEETLKTFLPTDKIRDAEEDMYCVEFLPEEDQNAPADEKQLHQISRVVGMDYETALHHSGGDPKILKQILSDLSREGMEKGKKIRMLAESGQYEEYGIEAHSVKSLMATVGLQEFSDVAKEHEAAGSRKDTAFIEEHYEEFLEEYELICRRIGELL